MINVSRFWAVRLVVFGVLILTSWAQDRPPVAEQVAKTYGLDSWGQIDAIRYTFNLDLPGLKLKVSRSWIWEPKADRVSFDGKDKAGNPVKVTYVRSQISSQPDVVKNEVDPGFVNDQYWMFFPFHVVWDTGAKVEDKGKQKMPLGKVAAQQLTVTYPSGGYTPGDTWTLFLGDDHRVQEMLFHHGGNAKPSVVNATWAGYKKAGPLLFSTAHKGMADGKPMTLNFTDVAVKLAGSDTWVEAK